MHLSESTFDLYPKLEAFFNRMSNLPTLKKYLAGPHYAKTADKWMPAMAKIDMNSNLKVRMPPKLYYFEVDGRAGGIRILLAHANVRYIDARLKLPDFAAKK